MASKKLTALGLSALTSLCVIGISCAQAPQAQVPQPPAPPAKIIKVENPAPGDAQPEPGKIEKIGTGDLTNPVSLRVSPRGVLLVLDKRDANFFVVGYHTDGQKVAEMQVPADIQNPNVVTADSDGNLYFSANGQNKVWQVDGKGKVSAIDVPFTLRGMTVAHVGKTDALYMLGENAADGIVKMNLPGGKQETIPLSDYPKAGMLIEPRVRKDGQIYAYSSNENIVYHFDAKGQFIETFGGGGPRPPSTGVPGSAIAPFYDVATNGDIVLSMANYGALIRLSADGKSAVRFNANESGYTAWTGPIHTLIGFGVFGDRGFEVDLGMKRITSFPLSIVADNAPHAETVDARIYGCSYVMESDAPYKVFTGDSGQMRLNFAEGNRRLHNVSIDYRLRDFNDATVKEGTVEMELPGTDAQKHDLPALPLPKMGWYQLDTSLRVGKDVLMQQVNFITRTPQMPALPIPAKETSGWNDLDTHRMIGMRLHRFGGSPQDLLNQKPQIEQAKQMGLPYFLAITSGKDCTAENVATILQAYPDLKILEIVNEPNLSMSVENYVALLKTCYTAAKRINPNVQIMGPTQCGTELNWFESFFKNGGGDYVDIVSVHTYERNNSMDYAHWVWKFNQLRAVMTRYNQGDKPLYQTEHGYLGDYHGPILRHRWQARSLLLELMTLPRFGIGMDNYYYYYVNQGGFADFSAYLVNGDRELYPAATMTRVRTGLIGSRKFQSALSFGAVGNNLLLGNRWSGNDGDLIELANTGSLKPIDLAVTLPANAKAYDCFGNPVTVQDNTLPVGMDPTYVMLPHGAAWKATAPNFGQDIAGQAQITVTGDDGQPDADAQKDVENLTNGKMEFDFENEPIRVGMKAADGDLPLDLTFRFAAPHRISGAILYSSLSDNAMTSPLDYEVQVHTGGAWKTVETVAVPHDEQILKIGGNTKRVQWYEAPWVFTHRFTPVQADALRFHFTHTTAGQYATPEMSSSVSTAFGGDGKPMPEHVELREVQIFE